MEQYDSIPELIEDGDTLGYFLDARGQGDTHWMEKFTAALEYEGCQTLKFALDIAQNLPCYEWMSSSELEDYAVERLRSRYVPGSLIQSGVINLEGYAAEQLKKSGYRLAGGESGYIIRNHREFVRTYTAADETKMTMQME